MSDAISALRDLAMPVVIVASADDRGPCGATATAMYTSLDPVELAVSLVATSRTARAVLARRELSVSLLGEGQADIAVRMAAPSDADDKWAGAGVATVERTGSSVPAVAGTTAFWGRLVATVPTGDHLVMIMRVEYSVVGTSGALLRNQRRYVPLPALDGAPDDEHPV